MYEYYYTLDTMLSRCKKLSDFQEMQYDSTLATSIFENYNQPKEPKIPGVKKLESEKKYIHSLKSTYQIITFIDNIKNNTAVSLQYPPKSPRVNSYEIIYEYQQW